MILAMSRPTQIAQKQEELEEVVVHGGGGDLFGRGASDSGMEYNKKNNVTKISISLDLSMVDG